MRTGGLSCERKKLVIVHSQQDEEDADTPHRCKKKSRDWLAQKCTVAFIEAAFALAQPDMRGMRRCIKSAAMLFMELRRISQDGGLRKKNASKVLKLSDAP
jgi:hypothetical protein